MTGSTTVGTRLLQQAKKLIDAIDDNRLERFRRHWPDRLPMPIQRTPRSLPVLEWGQTYSAVDFGEDFLQRYGWSELLGTRGPFRCDNLACGILLFDAHTHYPSHCHEAEEIYIPLTHGSRWQSADARWHTFDAGAVIFNASWQPHAIETRKTPLLILYLWQGGPLAKKSAIHGKSQ